MTYLLHAAVQGIVYKNKDNERWEQAWRTHFLAANTICSFLCRRLASRLSAVSSHVAFPPASVIVDKASASERKRSSKSNRDIRVDLGATFDDEITAVGGCPEDCPTAGEPDSAGKS
jgi:hypothetical protein